MSRELKPMARAKSASNEVRLSSLYSSSTNARSAANTAARISSARGTRMPATAASFSGASSTAP